MKQNKKALWGIMAAVVAVSVGAAVALDNFEMARSTIDGGGVTFSTGGDFELAGTIGQPDAGVLSGGDFTLTGGFWFETPPGDCNATGWTNLLDHGDLTQCLSGPGGGLAKTSCGCFDMDNDIDVDLSDIAEFQRVFGSA